MALLWTGLGCFVVGVVLIIVGRRMDAAAKADTRSVDIEVLQPFLDWFLGVLKEQWPLLTGEHGSVGKRLAAAGSLLVAISILLIVAGVVVAVGAATADAVTSAPM